MNALTLALLLSLPVPKFTPSATHRPVETAARHPHKGKWYFAATGHAVFCYGPVMYVTEAGGLKRVATFCQNDQPMVPLKD